MAHLTILLNVYLYYKILPIQSMMQFVTKSFLLNKQIGDMVYGCNLIVRKTKPRHKILVLSDSWPAVVVSDSHQRRTTDLFPNWQNFC